MNPQNCPFRAMRGRISGFLTEPYKPFFSFGVIYTALIMGLWFVWLHGIEQHRSWVTLKTLPLGLHEHGMLLGFTSFFIAGFLLTAFPKWTETTQARGPANLLGALTLFVSQILILAGSLFSIPVFKLGLLLECLLMMLLFRFLVGRYRASPQRKMFDQSFMVLVALGFGILGQILYQLGAWASFGRYYPLSLSITQYPYLLLLMMSVSYRILPFFTANLPAPTTPRRGTHTLLIAFVLILILGGFRLIPTFSRFPFLEGLALISLGGLWLNELITWQWRKALGNFLLLTHYIAFMWMVLFLCLKGWLGLVSSPLLENRDFTLALEHLFFVGGISTLIWGIATRVTRGHGGLGLQLGSVDYILFVLLQVSTVVRVLFPFIDVLSRHSFHASFLWWLVFFIWAIRYLPVLTRKSS